MVKGIQGVRAFRGIYPSALSGARIEAGCHPAVTPVKESIVRAE